MKTILIIEDDKWISKSLKLYLKNSWFHVENHEEWINATNKIKRLSPDLVIMDINLPWKDWIQITKELREFSQIPIIMLTARTREIDKITGIEIWADDYVEKPFSPRELLARINSIIRRSQWDNKQNKKILVFDFIEIDTEKLKVRANNEEINLTKNEYDILKRLVEEDWKLLTRETIMKEVIWYEKYIYDRTIDTHIKNLRRKLWNKNIIITVRWEWYRLNK